MNDDTRRVMHSSQSVEWTTPPKVFKDLNDEFDFVLDAAATPENALCSQFYTERENGLARSWGIFKPGMQEIGNVYCNPPYGRGLTALWVAKGKAEAKQHRIQVVMLLPGRTGTRWFHEHIWDYQIHQPQRGVQVRYWKGRMKFSDSKDAPFDSIIVVFDGKAM